MCYPGRRNKLILQALERVEQNQFFIIKLLKQMANEIDNLQAAVTENTNVENSAVVLLNNLSILIKNAAGSGDLAKVQQLADQIHSSSSALAAAITANTPVVNPPPPPTLTDTPYTATTGETIVVSQAGATPAAGEAVTVNGAPSIAATFTLSDGAVLVIGVDSKVISYTAAPAL